MSDTTVPMLKRTREVFESKREAIDAVITHLTQTIALLEDDNVPAAQAALPAHEPKARKVRKAKAEKPAPAAKAKAGKLPPYTREDVVNIAIDLIRRKGPVKSSEISKEVYTRFSRTGTFPASHLAYEVKLAAKPRLVRTKAGLYDWNTTAKAVDVKRSPAEVEKALEQARANADRPATDQIRA